MVYGNQLTFCGHRISTHTRTWPCSAARYRQQVSLARHAFIEELPTVGERERERERARLRRSQGSLSLSLSISTLLQKPQCTKQLYSYEFTQPTRLHHHFFGSPLFPSARTSFLGAPLSIKRPTQRLSATLLGLERLSSACDLIL